MHFAFQLAQSLSETHIYFVAVAYNNNKNKLLLYHIKTFLFFFCCPNPIAVARPHHTTLSNVECLSLEHSVPPRIGIREPQCSSGRSTTILRFIDSGI